MSETHDLGARALRMLDELAACTDEPGRLTRLSFGPAHRDAAALVRSWMNAAGLATWIDNVGSVHGLRTSRSAGRRLVIGSHIDTVVDAGRFDGMLGVVVGILAAECLAAEAPLPFDLEIVAFGDEEGLRFPGASIGSLALSRDLPAEVFDTLDAKGVPLRQALADFGVDTPGDRTPLRRDPAEFVGYLEVHIEQGPVLEALDAPLGIVTSIAAAARLRVVVTGPGGHAGTVPMSMRRDPLSAAAEMLLAIEAVARDAGDGVVATVGEVTLDAAAANAIPRSIDYTVDARAPQDDMLAEALDRIFDVVDAVADARGVRAVTRTEYRGAATICAPDLAAAFSTACEELGVTAPALASGAGHDAQSLALVTPVAMLFVRSLGGVSHVPAEDAAPHDVGIAVSVLARTVGVVAARERATATPEGVPA